MGSPPRPAPPPPPPPSQGLVPNEPPGELFIVLNPANPLPVQPRTQEGFYSCWATSAEMIMDFLGRHVPQCQQATRPTDTSLGCCDTTGALKHHPDCDLPDYPDFDRWGFAASVRQPNAPLSWQEVKDQIDGGQPFAFSWIRKDLMTANGAISHMMVVVGYSQSGGPATQMLLCLNPRPFAVADEIMIPYSEYNSSPTVTANIASGHVHQGDYFNIHAVASPTGGQ